MGSQNVFRLPVPLSSKKRAWISIAALVLLAAAGAGVYLYRMRRPLSAASAGATPTILNQLPPDAPAVIYLDVAALRKLQDSPLAAILGLTDSGARGDRDYQKFVRDTGFDYTRDLDKTAIALWPANLDVLSHGPSEERTFVVAEGRFDQPKIEAYALRSGRVVTHGAQSVYEIPGNPPVSFEFLSPTQIALASGKETDALPLASNSAPRDPVMQARMDRVGGAPIFALARTDHLPDSFYADFRDSPQLEALARSVQGVTLAGQPEDGLIKISLDAECDTMKSAIEIAALLDGFRMMGTLALSDPKTRSHMNREQAVFLDAVIRTVKIAHQDRWVRLTLGITPEMLGAHSSVPSTPIPPSHSNP
jgi:hypothetical protein